LLKELEDPNNYNKNQFQHEEIKLESTDKQAEINQIITNYAKIAEENR
jgi:hypothetical protein